MTRSIYSLALLTALVTLTRVSAAATPTVGLAALCDDARVVSLHDVLRTGLADRGFSTVDAPVQPLRPVHPCNPRAGQAIAARLAKADDAFYALKLAESREALIALREELRLLGLPAEHGATYVHATVLLARIALQTKDRAEAERLAAETGAAVRELVAAGPAPAAHGRFAES